MEWEKEGSIGEDNGKDKAGYEIALFAAYVRAYATKNDIQLPLEEEELAEVEVVLPKTLKGSDPRSWSSTLGDTPESTRDRSVPARSPRVEAMFSISPVPSARTAV
ncbi:hypothetical protein BDV59DRAFT_198538 [Aspergillus ambiguus]|uniref:uncharacterized protein n=1 Tax=Aspergillus ambiguus TaxID=176160 RepID=UPI003CCD8D4A